jgi:hypothetical protein
MAYTCNGTNQYFTTSAVPVTAPPFTFGCWFKTTQMSQSPALISLVNSSNTANIFGLYFRGSASGDPIQLLSAPPATNTVSSTTGCTSDKWHHACGVHTSLSSRTIYLDGGSSATNTATLTTAGIDSLFIATNGLGANYLNGQIAEVGIWNAALTAAEVESLAKGMTCDKVRPESLVFYAPLVRDLQDLSGGLTITNNNAATVATHPRVYA